VGNCGFSYYGVHKESVFKNDVGGELFKAQKPGSLDDYAKLMAGKLDVNLIPLVGHGTTRTAVAGKKAQPLTRYELNKQLEILEDNLKQGAFGGSLGLMYVPSQFAPRDELVAFAQRIQAYDGILTVHPRACSKVSMAYPLLSRSHLEQGLDEVLDILKETKVRMEYSHLIFVGKSSWKSVKPMLKKFEEAVKEGYSIGFDLYPFTYGASVITVVLPAWYLSLSKTQKQKPSVQLKLKFLINVTKGLLGISFSDMTVAYIKPGYEQYEGKTIAQIAKEENKKEIDMYLELVDLSEGKGRIMMDKYYNEAIIDQLMKHDLSVFMTDAWYESAGTQNAGTYQAFPLFLQKARQKNYPIESIIRKMTGLTADRFQLVHRGYLKEGYFADITVFDLESIDCPLSTPNQSAKGIDTVLVNGEISVRNEQFLKPKSGRLLRKNKE
jgi:N-acyl-D-amino-acid deacylase